LTKKNKLNDFVLSGAPLEILRAKQIVPVIRSHIETARNLDWLVVYVCDRHEENDKEFEKWPKHAVKETSGSYIVSALRPKVGDLIISKKAFEYRWEAD